MSQVQDKVTIAQGPFAVRQGSLNFLGLRNKRHLSMPLNRDIDSKLTFALIFLEKNQSLCDFL